MECYQCGVDIAENDYECQKCGATFGDMLFDAIHIVDVAHQGEIWDDARQKILRAVDFAISQKLKGVKIIHGRGKNSGGKGVIKNNAILLMRQLAKQYSGKVVQDKYTDGAHLLYFT